MPEDPSFGSAPPPDPTAPPPYQPPPAYPPPPPYQPPPAYPPPPPYQPPAAYPVAPTYPGAPFGYPPFPPPPPQPVGWNGMAIASFIFGILGGVLFSIGFGITALVQLRKNQQRGRGLAIAGLSISGCWLLLICVGVFAAILDDVRSDTSSASPSITVTSTRGTQPGSDPAAIAATGWAPGDCVDHLTSYSTVDEVSCAVPHDGEIFAVFNLPDGPWPGEDAVERDADLRCHAYLLGYAAHPDTLDYFPFYPKQEIWPGDRSVVCVAYDEDGADLRGSIHR